MLNFKYQLTLFLGLNSILKFLTKAFSFCFVALLLSPLVPSNCLITCPFLLVFFLAPRSFLLLCDLVSSCSESSYSPCFVNSPLYVSLNNQYECEIFLSSVGGSSGYFSTSLEPFTRQSYSLSRSFRI
jgi:hypothetical protein